MGAGERKQAAGRSGADRGIVASSRLAALGARGRLLPNRPAPGTGGVTGGWVPEPDPEWPGGTTPPRPVPAAGTLGLLRERVADRLPPALRAGTRRVPPRAAVAAVAVALAVIAGIAARGVAARPHVSAVPVAAPATTAAATLTIEAPGGDPATGRAGTAAGAASGAAGQVVVDVAGKVRHPGLVRLPAGSRVADAITAAGGAARGAALARINLARPVGDGEQVLVPGPDDPLPATGTGVGAGVGGAGSGSGAVDLNAATREELDALPGIGPVLAGRILQWRTTHGRFSSVDELAEVAGIGEKVLARLRPLVRV